MCDFDSLFKYRIMVRTPNTNWKVFDDVLDMINACAIADELIDGWEIDNERIVIAKVIEKSTNKCIYKSKI